MIGYDIDADGVCVLMWDMPDRKQNVFNQASMDAFEAALGKALADDAVTGLVITSGKKDFIAGADLDAVEAMTLEQPEAAELHERTGSLSRLLRRMETGGKPVVAAINGTALGGGFELALACHHRILSDDRRAKVGLPESQLGLLPGAGGTQRLPRMIGVQASLPLLLEGKQLSPDKALKAGLVDAIAPRDELVAAAKAWLATRPTAVQPWDVRGFMVPGGGAEDPKINSTFMVASAMYAAKTFGNYPAGTAILSCVFEGLRVDIDTALEIEVRYFVSLLRGPVAKAMVRTMFLSMQAAAKLARRPADVPKLRPARIGVLGAGLMGAGIAFVAAKAGIEVEILDVTADKASAAVDYAAKRLDKAIARGRSTEAKKAELLARIHPGADYAALAACDVVVEAVFEDRDVKAAVTAKADAVLADTAVLASNTSTLPITGLAEASSRPANFIGLHFFSPVEKMPLVEIIVGEHTTDTTLAHAMDLVQAIGKTPIVVNDARGFYTSRVFGTYITEGLILLREGVTPALIENAGKAAGMPMPPLGLADEVGLGLMYQVGVQTKADLGADAPINPGQPVLEKMVQGLDRAGRRGGRGFYAYEGAEKRLWSGLSEFAVEGASPPSVGEVVERFLFAQAIEAARCMDEGVLRSHEDADVGAILGWGFAPYTGGPLLMIDTAGLPSFVARADTLADAHGERFRPPELLRRMAAEGLTFYG